MGSGAPSKNRRKTHAAHTRTHRSAPGLASRVTGVVQEPPRHRAAAPGSRGHSHAPNSHHASPLPPSQLKRLDYHPGKGVGLFLAKLDRIKERYYFEMEHETSVLFYAPKIRVREGS